MGAIDYTCADNMNEMPLSVLNVKRYTGHKIPPYKHMERLNPLRTANIAMS